MPAITIEDVQKSDFTLEQKFELLENYFKDEAFSAIYPDEHPRYAALLALVSKDMRELKSAIGVRKAACKVAATALRQRSAYIGLLERCVMNTSIAAAQTRNILLSGTMTETERKRMTDCLKECLTEISAVLKLKD